MLRRALLYLVVMLILPCYANAYNYWSVSVSTSPALTGAITPPSGPGFSTSGNTTSITASNILSANFTVRAPVGYTLSYVTVDGARVAPSANDVYTVSKGTKVNHTLAAVFTAQKLTITTSKTGNGYIDPTVQVNYGASKTIVMLPSEGHRISSVATGGATLTGGDGVTGAAYTFSDIQQDKSISVAFEPIPVLVARISTGPQSIGIGNALVIDGSASSTSVPALYSWSVTPAGASVTPAADGKSASFLGSAKGSYTVKLVLSAAGATPSEASVVISVVSQAQIDSTTCLVCHTTRNPDLAAEYLDSPHARGENGASCSGCHNPGGTLQHTYLVPAEMGNICRNCHADPQGEIPGHPVEIGVNACVFCHNPHTAAGMPRATHYNNVTSAGYPASYVTSRSACTDCHYGSESNKSHRLEWAASGHASPTAPGWRARDFKTLSGCVQCHSTSGFIAYSTGRVSAAWGEAADKTKELLTCIGCHKDVAAGVVRTLPPIRPFADDAFVNRDFGKSNVCLACHSGLRNGASISALVAAGADFGDLPFVDPHYRAAGGILQAKAGYHFPDAGYDFYSTNSHRTIGVANSNGTGSSGPCVACHRNSENAHTNKARVNTLCGNCHNLAYNQDRLDADKGRFGSALKVLGALLAEKGYGYAAASPHFDNRNWGNGQAGANVMGAAFNYAVLSNDPGSYAHNSGYARKLILDSIDVLYHDGDRTGSVDDAVTHLLAQGRITQQEADALAAYRDFSSCNGCHLADTLSHPAHLRAGFGCVDCHSQTAASNLMLVPGQTSHLNGVADLAAGPGRSFGYAPASSGGTCSSISCHNRGTAVWGGTLGCDGCHDAPPATPSHLKHFGGTPAQARYGSTSIAQDLTGNAASYLMNCGNCHPLDAARHGNGVVEVELYNPQAPAGSLKALNPSSAGYLAGLTQLSDSRGFSYTNGTCSNIYCHSYNDWTTSAAIPDGDPEWEAKVVVTRKYRQVTWESGALGCAGCHGNPTQTAYPANDGGAGDSHSWMDPYGYQNLHTYNMSEAPLSCRTCHNDTVKAANSYTSDGMDVRTLSEVPISNFSKHVNGKNDVAFDRQNPISYFGNPALTLDSAVYNQATRTCSNVSCHQTQTVVKWGKPYRWYYNECDSCHGYMY